MPFRFKSDLEISQQESSGQIVYIIKNPHTGKFYRLKQMEYFIAIQLDGSTDSETIAAKFTDKFKAKINAEQIGKFAQTLLAMGLVEDISRITYQIKTKVRKSLFSRVLFIKFKTLNPEKFVESTYKISKPFYTRTALDIYLIMILLAAGITIANFADMKYQFISFFRPEIIPLAWITIFFVTVIHEFSHTYSCRIHGGKVTDMGFLLLYLQPCFYSNVSDAYLFADRKKRMAVTLAGIISQIVIWAIATLIWRLTSMDNIINTVAFIIIALSFVGITFNLNPLLKLDGYYFLIDYWEITNLRSKAFRYLRQNFIGLTHDELKLEATPREARIFFWYGAASILYSGALIAYIAYRIGKYLNTQMGSFGVALLLMFILYLIFDAFKKGKVFRVLYDQRGEILKPHRVIITAAVLLAIAALLVFIRMPHRIADDCVIWPLEQVNLKATSPGSAELYVERANGEKALKQFQLVGQDYSVLSILPALKVGDNIQPGDLIAGVVSNEYDAEKLERLAGLEQAKRQLDLLVSGAQPEEIKQTRDEINQVQAKLAKSQQDLDRAESLYVKGGIPQEELESARANNQVLKSELDFYKNQLTLLKRGARPEELDIAKADVEQLEAQLKHLESQLEQTRIESPIKGIVTQVKSGDIITAIARTDTVKIKISVPEKEISAVAIGNEVKMKAHSYPGLTYSGEVVKIDPLALKDDRGRSIVTVTALIANEKGLLKDGMTGKAKINCGRKPLYQIFLWRIVRYLRIEFWSWW